MSTSGEETRRALRVYQVDAFTATKFAGNPAAVVSDADALSSDEMQAIAREMNCSETAFLLSPVSDDHDIWVRYFTPTSEVPICGHATIAAHYVRATEVGAFAARRVRAKTGAGILPVDIEPVGRDFAVTMTQGAVQFAPPLRERQLAELLEALGLDRDDLDPRCPPQIVSTGHSKVLVGLKTVADVDQLRPDLATLQSLSIALGCNGYFAFAFTRESSALTYGRMFAPAIGINEDPVTGNANGPLGAYLVEHHLVDAIDDRFEFTARQGDALGRPGSMRVAVTVKDAHPISVAVTGRAVIVFSTELIL